MEVCVPERAARWEWTGAECMGAMGTRRRCPRRHQDRSPGTPLRAARGRAALTAQEAGPRSRMK